MDLGQLCSALGQQGEAPPATTPTSRHLEVELRTSVLQRSDLQDKLAAFRRTAATSWWELGRERFQRSAVDTLLTGQGTSTFLVDALLEGPTADLAAGQWDDAFGDLPHDGRPDSARVYLVPQSLSAVFMKTQGVTKASDQGLAPQGRMKHGFWFKQVRLPFDTVLSIRVTTAPLGCVRARPRNHPNVLEG